MIPRRKAGKARSLLISTVGDKRNFANVRLPDAAIFLFGV